MTLINIIAGAVYTKGLKAKDKIQIYGMAAASYAGSPRNVMSIGLMTAAALMPANPVPSPAPMPAIKQMINLNILSFLL